MWDDLPADKKEEYKKLILAFASLTKAFAQKADADVQGNIKPIINSKYQESAFCRAFGAYLEDKGNTAYDASLAQATGEGTGKRYVIGLKTFGYDSGKQKIAQFKANHADWEDMLVEIKRNAETATGNKRKKQIIDKANEKTYIAFAKYLAELRNKRIDSALALLKGFNEEHEAWDMESVYHVLMPFVRGNKPEIIVGETSYDKIDIENIKSEGCTLSRNPDNFNFTDGKHRYSFTAADSQLYMDFDNVSIRKETWPVSILDDPYSAFMEMAEKGQSKEKMEEAAEHTREGKPELIQSSFSWFIAPNTEVEKFSGYNAFYGVASKLDKNQRSKVAQNLKSTYAGLLPKHTLGLLANSIGRFVQETARSDEQKKQKAETRNEILKKVQATGNDNFIKDAEKLLYRPSEEMYIPIPQAKEFHEQNPDFFGKKKNEEGFNLIFEPSGNTIKCFITQQDGKAIESKERQSILGKWILREVFQLNAHEPLTKEKLDQVGINGIRLYKVTGSEDVHLEFVWIDEEEPPEDLFPKVE